MEIVDMFDRNDIVIADRLVVASTDYNIHAKDTSLRMMHEEQELISMELSHEHIQITSNGIFKTRCKDKSDVPRLKKRNQAHAESIQTNLNFSNISWNKTYKQSEDEVIESEIFQPVYKIKRRSSQKKKYEP